MARVRSVSAGFVGPRFDPDELSPTYSDEPSARALWARLTGQAGSGGGPEPARATSPPRLSARVLREYQLLAGLVGGAAVVALLAVPNLPRFLWPLGLLVGLSYYALASRRERRRARLLQVPFPEPWRQVLEQRVAFYQQLDEPERRRFESEIQIFLGEQRIYGLRVGAERSGAPGLDALGRPVGPGPGTAEFEITEEHRVLIAASAATLLLGRPEWRLPTVRDIIVYPTAFTEESYAMDGHSHTIGMVHAQGPILFAVDALERSYPRARPRPAVFLPPWFGWGVPGPESHAPTAGPGPADVPTSNVGIHEFAHVLDFIGQGGRAPGAPTLIEPEQAARWHEQISVERERLASGNSLLHPYGLKNEAELFAVAVESFFQEPLPLRAHHPELYGLLSELFNQDPAARAQRGRLGLVHGHGHGHRPLFALAASAPIRYQA